MTKALSPREELIKIQRRLFKKNEKIIEDSILLNEPGFLRYEQNYLRHVKAYQKAAKIDELIQSLSQAKWIYLGDYHTNRQSQRAFLRLLKLLITQTDHFVICLEFIKKRHQPIVNQYLHGRISLNKFLKEINIKKNFYFDLWENFAPIFDFAKYYKIEIYGIEAAPLHAGLKIRDQAMAKVLAKIAAAKPGYKIFTFVGDLHIAPENLPAQVKKVVGKPYQADKELFLYQNSEKIYWQLAAQKLEDKTELVRIDKYSYALINTPPIVWQQSYLNWLEHEEGEIDYLDPKHSFLELAQQIAYFLGLKLPKAKDDVEVFTCGDLSFLERLKSDADFSLKEKKIIRRQIELSESYYIPKRKWVYLANVSLNHAAEEAAHFVRHLMAGDEFPRTSLDAFYANVLHEAMGFFGSKIINQKRKCLRVEDFKSMIAYFKRARVPASRVIEVEVAKEVLAIKQLERQAKPVPNPEGLLKVHEMFFGASHALGYMLGEVLYHAMLQGHFTKPMVRKLFSNPFAEEGEPFRVYIELVKRFKQVKLPQRI